jgi:hypothetical protein
MAKRERAAAGTRKRPTAEQKSRETLHRLVDELPKAEFAAARRYLEYLRNMADPTLRGMLETPYDDEPLTPEEERAVAEAKAEYEAGNWRPWEEVRKELLEE